MIELRFHRDLYNRPAIDEAVATYAAYGAIAVIDSSDAAAESHVRVQVAVTADGDVEEDVLAAELANYALGRSIEGGAM